MNTRTNVIVVVLLLMPAVARAQSPGPDLSSQAPLKRAVLQWALDEAHASAAAGEAARAAAITADVRAMLARDVAAAQPAPANLFPPVPDFADNEYAKLAMASVRKIVDSKSPVPRGSVDDAPQDEHGWRYPRLAGEAVQLVQAFAHPQSPLAGDPKLVAPMLSRMAAVYRVMVPGSRFLVDFGVSDNLPQMYLLLHGVYPNLLPPTIDREWTAAIQTNADAVLAKYGNAFEQAVPGTCYANGHVRYIACLQYSGLVLHRDDWRRIADSGVKLMSGAVYPDGAFPYIGAQNEVFTYHGISVSVLARYWQVTGNELARQVVERTRWYYPLSIEPRGVAEYASAVSWKPYWNGVNGADAAAIVAAMTEDPQNKRVAELGFSNADLILASYWRPGLRPAPPPDNYITFDRNVLGPRGRFGDFSFVGTARAAAPPGDVAYDLRGKGTFVGCLMLDPADALPKGANPKWPLNAALQDATAEVRFAPGDAGLERQKTHAWLAQADVDASTVARDFAAITARYHVTRAAKSDVPWTAEQAWLFTPERLVGLVRISADRDASAFDVDGAIKLVSGRATTGVRKEFSHPAPDTYTYGRLCVRLWQHDFPAVTTQYTDTFSGDAKKSGRILLLDRADDAATPASYAKGASHFYLVEIHPDRAPPAESVRRIDAGELIAIELTDARHTFRLVFNPTPRALTYHADLGWHLASDHAAHLHLSGESYRAGWLPPLDDPGPAPRAVISNTVDVPVAAGAHVVFVADR